MLTEDEKDGPCHHREYSSSDLKVYIAKFMALIYKLTDFEALQPLANSSINQIAYNLLLDLRSG